MFAWNKIVVDKYQLKELYCARKLSIAQIGKLLHVSRTPVHRALKEFNIPIRSLSVACTKIIVSKKELQKWYFKDKMSMFKIADKLNCTHSAVVSKFKQFGLKSRGHLGLTEPIKLTKKGFEYLYDNKGLSLKKISRIAHCSESGLERRFKEYKIKSRTIKNRACKYKKYDFSGDPIEKAYLIGFRLGDLNVMKRVSVTLIRCSTTIPAQTSLIRNLFKSYTTPHVWKAKRGTTEIVCLVNKSFDFLLPKEDKIPCWIQSKPIYFWSFFAGYSDAEGCISIFKSKTLQIKKNVNYQITTYDKRILLSLRSLFNKFNIGSYFFLKAPRGTRVGKTKYYSSGDAWCLTVSGKQSLWDLIEYWKIYSKHADKIKRIYYAEKNLILRNYIKWSHPIKMDFPNLV